MLDVKDWKQLNNIPETSAYIEFPLSFTGKTKNGMTSAFTSLSVSAQFILAEIHTMNKIYKEAAKLTYKHFIHKFGMSRETVSAGFKTLLTRKIIERVKQSHYLIKAAYNKKDYIEIDVYWLKREWDIDGKKKRLSRSRFLPLALLVRSAKNPNSDGKFISSQARIGKAVNMPRTTAGDSIREIIATGLISCEKQYENDKRRRGCSLFEVNPQILEVKHPNINSSSVKALFGMPEPTADELHAQLMLDTKYRWIIDRININYIATLKEITEARGEDTLKLAKLEAETAELREELENYFKIHKIKRGTFPPGFFRTDITDNKAI